MLVSPQAKHSDKWLPSLKSLIRIREAQFLGVFTKLRKAAISIVMSVSLSVRPHETTRLPLAGFSLNLTFEYFSKICRLS